MGRANLQRFRSARSYARCGIAGLNASELKATPPSGAGPSTSGVHKITVFGQTEHLPDGIFAPLWCPDGRQMGLVTTIFRIER